MQFKICLLSSKEMARLQGRARAERDRKRGRLKTRERGERCYVSGSAI